MDELFLCSLDAEESVIGAILSDEDLIKECPLLPEQFGYKELGRIYWAMKTLEEKGKTIDLVNIVEQIGQDKLHKVKGISYITSLARSVPTLTRFKSHIDIVLEYHKKRRAIEITKEMTEIIRNDNAGNVLQETIESLVSLNTIGTDEDDGDIKAGLVDMYEDIEQEKGDVVGIPSGFHDLDNLTGGFQNQDLVIIGARPSMGKTAFALNTGLNASKTDMVAIFSLEMPKIQLLKRFTSSIGNIDSMKMRNGRKNFTDDDWRSLTLAMGTLSNSNIRIFDKSGIGVEYIYSKVRKLKKEVGDSQRILVIIDYLQLLVGHPKHQGNRQAEISEISRSLKNMARELNVCVIALSQLSRSVESRQDKRPMQSDLRESGQIEQDADVIAFLYRDDYYDKESELTNILEVIIAKQRNGPIGTVQLAFIKEYNKFVNLERRHSA